MAVITISFFSFAFVFYVTNSFGFLVYKECNEIAARFEIIVIEKRYKI